MNVKEWTLHDGMRRRLSILLMMMMNVSLKLPIIYPIILKKDLFDPDPSSDPI